MKVKKKYSLILVVTFAFILTNQAVYADEIPSPRQQMKNGVAPQDVVCKDGFALVIRAASNTAACVKTKTSIKLTKVGWAKSIEKTALQIRAEQKSLGTVKTVQIVERFVQEPVVGVQPGIKGYNYIFQICAADKLIRNPEVLVASDSESKTVKLSQPIKPNTCQISSTQISAADKSSINGLVLKKAGISALVTSLESKVIELQSQLEQEKVNLAELATQDVKPADFKQQVQVLTNKILELRNELNNARAELHRNNYLLYVSPAKTLDPKLMDALALLTKDKSATKPEMKDQPHVNKVDVVRKFAEEKRLDLSPRVLGYNFIFQACAGKDDIKFPEVIAKSDSEAKSVKLGAELKAGTCQTTSTSIKAADKDSIEGVLVTAGGQTALIKELEAKVADLRSKIEVEKETLADLTEQTPPPTDFQQKVSELTDKIIKLRNELNNVRAELQRISFMINQ